MDKVFSIISRVKNIFNKPTFKEYKEFFITSRDIKMRNPIDKNGLWIGWTAEETVNHLSTIHLPPQSGKK
jgi:hypothetical protein